DQLDGNAAAGAADGHNRFADHALVLGARSVRVVVLAPALGRVGRLQHIRQDADAGGTAVQASVYDGFADLDLNDIAPGLVGEIDLADRNLGPRLGEGGERRGREDQDQNDELHRRAPWVDR